MEIVATIEEEEQGGTTKNQVSSFIDEEFALKMATTREEEHVRTTNTVLLQNTGSTHEEQINANTIDKIFLEVCASQAVAVEHKVPSSLPPPPPMMNCHSVVYYLVTLRWRRVWNLRRL